MFHHGQAHLHRLGCFGTGFALALLLQAQKDGSLTEEFPELSAKERSRIAAKEVEEAQHDADYQKLMQAADAAFQEARYEEALSGYEKARALRPYNVYPKVKIEDIKAMLAMKAVPPEGAPPPVVQPPPAPPVRKEEPPVQPHVAEPVPVPAPQQKSVPPPEAPVVHSAAAEPTELEPADSQMERRYREGTAFVIERVVTVDGRLVVYKRVFHNWGQVFYFEDGSPVDERVWKARFPR